MKKKLFSRKTLRAISFFGIFLMIASLSFSNIEANTGVDAWDKIINFMIKLIDFVTTVVSIAGVLAILIMIGLEVFAPDMGRSTKMFITIVIVTSIALSAKVIIVLLGGTTLSPELITSINLLLGV